MSKEALPERSAHQGKKRKRIEGDHAAKTTLAQKKQHVKFEETAQQTGPAAAQEKQQKTDRKDRKSGPVDRKFFKSQQQPRSNSNVPQHLIKKRNDLLPVRKALPIWPKAADIRAALKKNNVLVLTGETGSGKSTQVPQFLIDESWCTKCIAVTQPRRVAAISLARRVAEEMGSFMGSQSPQAKVGYSVRFDNAAGPNTRIKFLTEGMLLQEMLRDSTMSQYSAVVVDEVHERSVNVDLILGFLRNLVDLKANGGDNTRKHPLKVVVMSATADVESLVKFFDEERASDAQTVHGATTENEEAPKEKDEAVEVKSRAVSTCFVEGRQYPVKTTFLPQATQDWVETALKLVFQIHYKEPLPGDILVFLTGQDTIEALEKLINDYAEGMEKDIPKVSSIPGAT